MKYILSKKEYDSLVELATISFAIFDLLEDYVDLSLVPDNEDIKRLKNNVFNREFIEELVSKGYPIMRDFDGPPELFEKADKLSKQLFGED